MVWPKASEDAPRLSYEAFQDLARQQGIDMRNEDHLKLLYEDTLGLLGSMAELLLIDVGNSDPSDVYVPGSEVV